MIRMTAKLQKWGNSQGLRIPKEILRAAMFNEDETVELIADETGIKIQKAQKIETLADLFKNYKGDYQCQEAETGESVGREAW